jgi:hypothetical protein
VDDHGLDLGRVGGEGLAEPPVADVDDVAPRGREGEDARGLAPPRVGAVVEVETLQVVLSRLSSRVEDVLQALPRRLVEVGEHALAPRVREPAMRSPHRLLDHEAVAALPQADEERRLHRPERGHAEDEQTHPDQPLHERLLSAESLGQAPTRLASVKVGV